MKKIIVLGVMASFLGFWTAGAQEKPKDTVKIGEGIDRTAKKVGKATSSTAKKIGHATASTASRAAAKVSDKVYKGKSGPEGQTIYINNHAKFYYVDSKGSKVFLEEAELKDKE